MVYPVYPNKDAKTSGPTVGSQGHTSSYGYVSADLSDIWSLGAVLYELVALNPPFTAKDMKGLYNRVMKGVYPKIPSHYSSDLNTILSLPIQ